ncbi:MAG TPA: HEAT repeat domain-containing protein [Planctomycetota bacterium]|nr:HEAT repeat domain-containing protein [Planctomycetota bacterium]
MLLLTVLLALAQEGGRSNEPLLRDVFAKEFKDKDPIRRLEAVRRLSSQSEEKTILLLADALRDPDLGVRKAVIETIASCTDRTGAGIKPLCAILVNKKEDKGLRIACAKALSTAKVKAEAFDALVQAITSIGDLEKDIQPFVSECTRTLSWLSGQDFGGGKEAPEKWKKWWADSKARITKEDQDLLGIPRKPPPAKGK